MNRMCWKPLPPTIRDGKPDAKTITREKLTDVNIMAICKRLAEVQAHDRPDKVTAERLRTPHLVAYPPWGASHPPATSEGLLKYFNK